MLIKNEWIKISFSWSDVSHNLKLSLFEISSGLQKSIRRWLYQDAFIYLNELIDAWQFKYIWKRIFTYIIEDIGFANLYIAELINKLYIEHKKILDNNWQIETKFMFLSIYIISKSQKNREIDNLYNLVTNLKYLKDIDNEDIEYINTYCVEKIYNSKSKKIKDEINGMLRFNCISQNQIIVNNYLDSMNYFWENNGDSGLNLYILFFYMLNKYNFWKDLYKNNKNEFKESIYSDLMNFKIILDYENFEIKDYIFDKHTYKGKTILNRWNKHFFTEWAYISNEYIFNNNIYSKNIFQYFEKN